MAAPEKVTSSLVGVVGNAVSGKDTLALALTNRGFQHISLSDDVRTEIQSRQLAINRKNQNLIANEMRQLHGGDYWLLRAISKASSADVVLSGIYAPVEALTFKQKFNGFIVAVGDHGKVDLHASYRRLVNRADGSRDILPYEEFQEAFDRENSGVSDDEANVGKVFELADLVISNFIGQISADDCVELIFSKINHE